MDPIFHSVRQFCDVTGLSRSTVYRLIARGEVPAYHFGSTLRIPAWVATDAARQPGELPGRASTATGVRP